MEFIAPIPIGDGSPVTRASAGTYWDAAGVLRTALANVLRVTYDPSDLGAAPYPLIEQAATNLFPASEDLSGWTGVGAPVVTPDAMHAPDGTNNADRVNAPGDLTGITRTIAGLQAGQAYTLSAYVEIMPGGSATALRFGTDADALAATFDPLSGALISAGASVLSTRVRKWGTNRYRLLMAFTASAASLNFAAFASGGSLSFSLWGLQLVLGSNFGSYVPSTQGTRAADVLGASFGLIASNLTENDVDDAPLYNPVTAYAVGNRVRRTETHHVYEAVQASTGKTPEANLTGTPPIWFEVRPTNQRAAFDGTVSTPSIGVGGVVQFVLRPGKVATALAVLAAQGADVRVAVVDKDGTLAYRKSKGLRLKNSLSITDYAFKPIVYRTDEVFDDLPPFAKGLICVTVTKTGSAAQVGDLVVGRLEDVGEMQWKPEIRTLRNSSYKDNGFGVLKFNKKRSAKLITADVFVENERTDSIVRLLDDYTDDPVVIIGDSRWTSLICLGFVQDFRYTMDSPGGSFYNVQIQGFV